MEKSDLNKLLEIRGVRKHFSGVIAVDHCDIEIEKGKITALIGPNGAGKTTLFNVISGILQVDDGEIVFSGEPIIGKSVEQISNLSLSRLLQHSHIFENLTVQQNIALAINNTAASFWMSIFGTSRINGELAALATMAATDALSA